MKKVFLEKIGSAAKNCNLPKEVEISSEIISREGSVLAVKILEEKEIYNLLELPSGRMAKIQKGDVLAVVLGNRRALKGFVGSVPKKLKPKDKIQILNLGGVAGKIESENLHVVGKSLNAEVLGQIMINGQSANIKNYATFKLKKTLESNPKIIIVSGTCMNAGKTTVCSEIVKHAKRKKLKVAVAKLAGIAAIRDTENMKDHGAFEAVSIIDAGLPSTVQAKNSVEVAKGAIDFLASKKPDLIVIEFGDGVLGEYGVMEIISDSEISKRILVHIGVAHDPVGALGLFEICKKIKNPIHIFSGPVTDNNVGCNFIRKELQTPAENAIYNGKKLWEKIESFL